MSLSELPRCTSRPACSRSEISTISLPARVAFPVTEAASRRERTRRRGKSDRPTNVVPWVRFRLARVKRLFADAVRVMALLPIVEVGRWCLGPAPVVGVLRRLGARGRRRSPPDRRRLRLLIGAIDRRVPDGGNCFRRALIEIGLDPESAKEPIQFGLRKHGGPKSGHAWLRDERESAQRYDAEFAL